MKIIFIRQTELVIFLADLKAPYFKPKVKLSLKDVIISSVVPGDYDGDSQMDVLLTTKKNSVDQETSVVIFWGNNQTLDERHRTKLNKTFQDEPLIMENLSWQKALDTDAKMHIPHSHAFIDVNKDFTAVDSNLNRFPEKKIVWGFVPLETSALHSPITLHLGDYNMDGFPDALAILRNTSGSVKTSCVCINTESEDCIPIGEAACLPKQHCILWSSVDRHVILSLDTVKEILDLMELSKGPQNELTIHALKNNFKADAYFVNVITGQLSQSAHFALQLPYTVLGLGRSANFLDHLYVGIPRPPGEKAIRKQEWTAINPNSQLIVIPYPHNNPHSWSVKLYLTPGNLVLLTAIALIAMCIFILTITGILHWQGKATRNKEHLLNSHESTLTQCLVFQAIRKQEWTAINPNSQLIVIPYPHNNPHRKAKKQIMKARFGFQAVHGYYVLLIIFLSFFSQLERQTLPDPRKRTTGRNAKKLTDSISMPCENPENPIMAVYPLLEQGPSVTYVSGMDEVQNVGGKLKPGAQCGTWIRNHNGGLFTSPNYPDTYPPNKECVYILEVYKHYTFTTTSLSSSDMKLLLRTHQMEHSNECKKNFVAVYDGSSAIENLKAKFCSTVANDVLLKTSTFSLSADCQFELSGADGVIRSGQVEEDGKIQPGQAVDCIWTVRAPPKAKIYLRFLEYQMEHSNECKKNFVAVYDGSSAIENLKAKFCSTVANDVMLETGTGVVRMWADESSRLSRFRMLFTSFVDPPCSGNTFFCHSNMCINSSLVCNGVQNCVYPWDENHCKEKKTNGLFHQITKTHGTIIGVSSGIVLVLLIISILVQVKQPRKKVLARKPAFNKSGFQEVFDPPHYELFSLRDKEISSDLADLSEELENYHKMRRSSTASRCIHDHHCGGQPSMVKESRTNLSSMELPYRNDFSQPQPMKTFNSTFKKSCYGYKQNHDCAEQVIEDRVMEEIPCEIYMRGSRNNDAVQRSMSIDF
ncbi:UNVERIFIED_CONTAM: hypothetical protein FKN15_040912 [Acipenser sinensis]